MEREFVILQRTARGSQPIRKNTCQTAGKEHSTGVTVSEEDNERRVPEERP